MLNAAEAVHALDASGFEAEQTDMERDLKAARQALISEIYAL